MRVAKRITKMGRKSASTQKMLNHMRDESFSEYFLEIANEEDPITKEKIKRRLSEDVYVLYGLVGKLEKKMFVSTIKSGIIVLFMRKDIRKMYLGLLVMEAQQEQEQAGKSPFVLVNPELIEYLIKIAFDATYKTDADQEDRDRLREEVKKIVSNNEEIFRSL